MLPVFDLYCVVERIKHNSTLYSVVHHEGVCRDYESIYCANVTVYATEYGTGILDFCDTWSILPVGKAYLVQIEVSYIRVEAGDVEAHARFSLKKRKCRLIYFCVSQRPYLWI
jgi:hypothetical protein